MEAMPMAKNGSPRGQTGAKKGGAVQEPGGEGIRECLRRRAGMYKLAGRHACMSVCMSASTCAVRVHALAWRGRWAAQIERDMHRNFR
eukprot:362621-Chlamydomonas_euryale.AAC.1